MNQALRRDTRIFISAVTRELGTVRQLIKTALEENDYHPIEQTGFPPSYAELREKLRERISTCDAVIHLAGECYGEEPPDLAERRSYTQIEYDVALELKKPVYAFITAVKFPADPHSPEDEERRRLQAEHRRVLETGKRSYELVGTREELDRRVRSLQLRVERLADELYQVDHQVTAAGRSLRKPLWAAVLLGLAIAFTLGYSTWASSQRAHTRLVGLKADTDSAMEGLRKTLTDSAWEGELSVVDVRIRRATEFFNQRNFSAAETEFRAVETDIASLRNADRARSVAFQRQTAARSVAQKSTSSELKRSEKSWSAAESLLAGRDLTAAVREWNTAARSYEEAAKSARKSALDDRLQRLTEQVGLYDTEQLVADGGKLWEDFQSELAKSDSFAAAADPAAAASALDRAHEMFNRITRPRRLHLAFLTGAACQNLQEKNIGFMVYGDTVAVSGKELDPVFRITKHLLKMSEKLYEQLKSTNRQPVLKSIIDKEVRDVFRSTETPELDSAFDMGSRLQLELYNVYAEWIRIFRVNSGYWGGAAHYAEFKKKGYIKDFRPEQSRDSVLEVIRLGKELGADAKWLDALDEIANTLGSLPPSISDKRPLEGIFKQLETALKPTNDLGPFRPGSPANAES